MLLIPLYSSNGCITCKVRFGILADGTLALRQVLIQVPGIVFARGPAVTMLILLESDGETYAVLTEQARVPTGRIILELPAGMTAPEELAKVRLIASIGMDNLNA
ncbi:nudix hydrolase 14, chloroplastic-like isoform X1 [Arachis hypogaea]|uniref:nudix hydrolase 14, chloroplastic-like isoform X1 n=1 Tax=Arachis hypogaea TaxID=3818 RepID=UPI000DED0FE8|nr:nudix hydrolase 14, chloroplastic-like isoform X1 [Arachis hypogaea]XP_025606570.1 nudix hydrolase 14, chloroplastic-like isoform X1 [Arachis hypogaea]